VQQHDGLGAAAVLDDVQARAVQGPVWHGASPRGPAQDRPSAQASAQSSAIGDIGHYPQVEAPEAVVEAWRRQSNLRATRQWCRISPGRIGAVR
jgi:hypothetical protein